MQLCSRTRRLFRVAVPLLALTVATLGSAQEPGQKQPGGPPSSRIQKKTYHFKEAGKDMEYALFVPSTYDKDRKTPLLVVLHGLGGNPQQIIRSRGLIDQAEEHGYIVAAPMGYNTSGWYGAQGPGGGFRGAGKGIGRPGGSFGTPPGTVLSPRVQADLKLTDEQKKKIEELQKEVDARVQKVLTDDQNQQLRGLKANAGRSIGGGFGGGQDAPQNLGELSEKDVMNVLAEVRQALNVDDKRIYLIGHSMGGAGTYHLGTRYPEIWAGLGPIAAASGQPRNVDKLKNIPVIVVHGDKDTVVPVASARRWVDRLKEQNVAHEYLELAGAGHGDVIAKGMPKIFEFFERQRKKEAKPR